MRQLERSVIADEQKVQAAETEAKRMAEQKRVELVNQYDYRMRLAHDLLMKKWFTRVPNDPHDLKEALEKTLPTNSSGPNQHLVVCGWEFPAFCQELLPPNFPPSKELLQSTIEQTAVIVGSDPYFQTTTIKSYLEIQWGETGKQILKITIETIHDGMEESKQAGIPLAGTWPTDLLSSNPLRLYAYNQHAILQLSTDDESFNLLQSNNDAIQAFLWLCQATRVQSGDSESPEISSRAEELITGSDGQINPPQVSFYTLKRMKEINPEAPGLCWANLFKRVVVTEADVDREWKDAKGLELSYELMVKLAAVETAVEVIAEEPHEVQSDDDDSWTGSLLEDSANLANSSGSATPEQGLVIMGFFTALVPIRHHNDTIQWHLEYKDPTDKAATTIDPQALKSTATRDSWFQTQDLAFLQNQKCILGWWNEANIMLGTESLQNHIQFGRKESVRKWTSHVKGTNSTLQLGASGLIPINISATIELERISNIQRFNPTTLYLAALDRASLETALIYDTSSNQAWLVPKLSLLLHMCHSYITTYQDPGMDPVPFVQPSTDPSKDIKEALQLAADTPICVSSNGTYPLSALLISLNASLVNSTFTEESNSQTFFRNTKLLARQYMDVVQEPSRGAGLAVVNVPEGYKAWKDLIDAVDSVLICANLGLAVQPKPTATCTCKDIPQGQGFLVAHSWCLEQILARQGKGESLNSLMNSSVSMTQDCSWELQGNAFPECSIQSHISPWEGQKASLQTLSGRWRLFAGAQSPVLRNQDQIPRIKGAVVFGFQRNKIQKTRR